MTATDSSSDNQFRASRANNWSF